MAYTKSALSKLNKDDLIGIAPDMRKAQISILPDTENKLSELRKNYNKPEVDLKVSKSTVTEAMRNHIIVLEQKCWSNEQYS